MKLNDEYAELNVQSVDGSQYGIGSVHFDSNFEMTWVGNNGVCLKMHLVSINFLFVFICVEQVCTTRNRKKGPQLTNIFLESNMSAFLLLLSAVIGLDQKISTL